MAKRPIQDFAGLAEQLRLYAQLKHDYKASGVANELAEVEKYLKSALKKIRKTPVDAKLAEREPDQLDLIKRLRPQNRTDRLWKSLNKSDYKPKIKGAFLGRCAGCTLGAPVELWPVDRMKTLAKDNNQPFPPTDYWTHVYDSDWLRYGYNRVGDYTRDRISGVPVDDDITYTLLGLIVAEEFGLNFTTEDVGQAWLKYLPMACTAEDVALNNLKNNIAIDNVGEKDNPFCEWIGAGIRADPWAYISPGLPERAAELAWRDAYLSHRRNGIYDEMFFASAISAAFSVSDPMDAFEIALQQIPPNSRLAQSVRWALKISSEIHDYRDARKAVEERFPGMNHVHAINNACLTIWGVSIGGRDFTRVISETVAMGMDNDCTAATAGSLVGAVIGIDGIPAYWMKNFNNCVWSYLNGKRKFKITALLNRFERMADQNFKLMA